MNLPSRPNPVKPDPFVVVIAAVSAFLTGVVLLAVLAATSREQQRMDRFGEAAAAALAELAVEPLMREDRMHLGVIGNRLAETAEITGVASFGADQRMLASSGESAGPRYTAPVTIDDEIIGYVRVAVNADAFAWSDGRRVVALVLAVLLIPPLVAVGFSLGRAAGRGELTLRWPRPGRRGSETSTTPEAAEPIVEEPDLPAPDIRRYLLAVNLYNQLTLAPTEREFELSLCAELAEAVAEIYQGQVVGLSGVGVLVDFDHTDDDDRPFQLVCAAFLLARLLRDEAPFGIYRLGLNVTECPADETLARDHPAIADAALLSALAKSMTLAISQPFAGALDARDRVTCRALVNPLLDELTTSGAGCLLVTALESTYAGLVEQQAAQLRSQRDAVESPPTF